MPAFKLQTSGVSRAWCPTNTHCCAAVSRIAQLRRSLVMMLYAVRHELWSEQTRKYQSLLNLHTQPKQHKQQLPETPMPTMPSVRVLETIDLSSSNVEHFLEADKPKIEA